MFYEYGDRPALTTEQMIAARAAGRVLGAFTNLRGILDANEPNQPDAIYDHAEFTVPLDTGVLRVGTAVYVADTVVNQIRPFNELCQALPAEYSRLHVKYAGKAWTAEDEPPMQEQPILDEYSFYAIHDTEPYLQGGAVILKQSYAHYKDFFEPDENLKNQLIERLLDAGWLDILDSEPVFDRVGGVEVIHSEGIVPSGELEVLGRHEVEDMGSMLTTLKLTAMLDPGIVRRPDVLQV